MSIKTVWTSAAILTGVVASNVALLGAAQAQHYEGHRGPAGHQGGYHAPAPVVRHAPPPTHYGYGHVEQRRHHGNGDKIAKGVAIGVGALILGGILANEANRRRDYE